MLLEFTTWYLFIKEKILIWELPFLIKYFIKVFNNSLQIYFLKLYLNNHASNSHFFPPFIYPFIYPFIFRVVHPTRFKHTKVPRRAIYRKLDYRARNGLPGLIWTISTLYYTKDVKPRITPQITLPSTLSSPLQGLGSGA